jgi:hypothetical protein
MLCNSSFCSESQREAALLLGQFAATDSDCKVDYIFAFCLIFMFRVSSFVFFVAKKTGKLN